MYNIRAIWTKYKLRKWWAAALRAAAFSSLLAAIATLLSSRSSARWWRKKWSRRRCCLIGGATQRLPRTGAADCCSPHGIFPCNHSRGLFRKENTNKARQRVEPVSDRTSNLVISSRWCEVGSSFLSLSWRVNQFVQLKEDWQWKWMLQNGDMVFNHQNDKDMPKAKKENKLQ